MATGDDRLAYELAAEAGRRLLALRASHSAAGGNDLRAAGDRLAHDYLAAELARRRPGDAVLSEEGVDDPVRLSADRVWIVDPLDGTREFGERGRTDWAVHVALWERGRLTVGAVALPALDRVLSTLDPPPRPPTSGRDDTLRVVVSRTRPAPFLAAMAERLGARLIPLGSAGAKVAAVLCGDADAYVHAGGQYEWDSAAPVAVARAAGFHACRIDGSALVYNQADTLVPDIVLCPSALTTVLLGAIASARAGDGPPPTSADIGATEEKGGCR